MDTCNWFNVSSEKTAEAQSLRALKRVSTILLYLLVSTRAVIGEFSGLYSPLRPAKI